MNPLIIPLVVGGLAIVMLIIAAIFTVCRKSPLIIPTPPAPPEHPREDRLLSQFPPLKRIDHMGVVFTVSHYEGGNVVAEYNDNGRMRDWVFNRNQLTAMLAKSSTNL